MPSFVKTRYLTHNLLRGWLQPPPEPRALGPPSPAPEPTKAGSLVGPGRRPRELTCFGSGPGVSLGNFGREPAPQRSGPSGLRTAVQGYRGTGQGPLAPWRRNQKRLAPFWAVPQRGRATFVGSGSSGSFFGRFPQRERGT